MLHGKGAVHCLPGEICTAVSFGDFHFCFVLILVSRVSRFHSGSGLFLGAACVENLDS